MRFRGEAGGSSWSARRRLARVSHWPPRSLEVLGGRHVRQLTRVQRVEIAEVLERNAGAFGVESEIQAVLDGRESPTRRLQRLLAASQEEH